MMDGRSQGEKKDMRGIGSRRTGRSLATLWHPYLEDAVGVDLVSYPHAVEVDGCLGLERARVAVGPEGVRACPRVRI